MCSPVTGNGDRTLPDSCNIARANQKKTNNLRILTRCCTNHLKEKGIQVCTDEGEHPSTKEDNSQKVKKKKIKSSLQPANQLK
jgi:hypothetical protein